jgi:hypothetical protein
MAGHRSAAGKISARLTGRQTFNRALLEALNGGSGPPEPTRQIILVSHRTPSRHKPGEMDASSVAGAAVYRQASRRMLGVEPRHSNELVQDTAQLGAVASRLTLRDRHNQFITSRHIDPPHPHPPLSVGGEQIR